MKSLESKVWRCFNREEHIGGDFDRREELLERLHQPPGKEAQTGVSGRGESPPPSRWTLRGIRATFDWLMEYSLSGVWRLLQRHGLRLRSAEVQLYSPDPDYEAKRDRLVECLVEAAAEPTEVAVIFVDEMGFWRWPDPAPNWGAAAPTPPPVAFRSQTKNTQWRLIGGLNAFTGQVSFLDGYIVGREKVAAFCHQLVATYPTFRCLYLVLDNWSIHTHPDVLEVIASLPKLKPVWLPTYAPWLNPIEKLWKWLRQHLLHLHHLAQDWTALKDQVRAFLDQFAQGSMALLYYVGLLGKGHFAQALRPQ